ncbi:hypothetical protein BCR32DRAFT_251203 [Anaeromyces robustus]|uniref:Uncharacterized protein n=1 Tax=Anaeromyces robustus TaxID=1754192 RepID=A0A1Y1VSJ3_9FUNG|nr:hypothetical protein BCR32DRAFT_251203 [Anaeromyces robustus]|eukprot:ORX64260.1 hypothetical protein BCR32DRAFT_251203 [Anaeromyces robustus]
MNYNKLNGDFLDITTAKTKLKGHERYIGNIDGTEFVICKGIGLIKDCKIILADKNSDDIVEPFEYGQINQIINHKDFKESIFKDLKPDDILNEEIKGKEVSTRSKIKFYNNNHPSSKINYNILCNYDYISIESEASKFIESRSNLNSNYYSNLKSKLEDIKTKISNDDITEDTFIDNLRNAITKYYDELNKKLTTKPEDINKKDENIKERDTIIKILEDLRDLSDTDYIKYYVENVDLIKKKIENLYDQEYVNFKNKYFDDHDNDNEFQKLNDEEKEIKVKKEFYKEKFKELKNDKLRELINLRNTEKKR